MNLGDRFYSCIEYLEPDPNPDQSISIEQIFMLTSKFHLHSRENSLTEELHDNALLKYSSYNISHLDPELIKWNSPILKLRIGKDV